MFADIIVDIKHEKLDRIFQYRIPEWLKEELNVGMEVVIPFGKGNRQTKGYVVGISETCDYDLSKVKEIEDISRNSVEIEAKLIALAAWMKSNYGGTMLQSLKTVLPIKEKENIVPFTIDSDVGFITAKSIRKLIRIAIYKGFNNNGNAISVVDNRLV